MMLEMTTQEWLLIALIAIGLLLVIGLYVAIQILKRLEADRNV